LKIDIDNQDTMNETADMKTEEHPMPGCFAREMNDNYTILDSSGFAIGMEHNKSEAEKYIAWYRNRHGMKVTVRENSKDDVRRALAVCPNIARHPNRDDIIYGHDRRARFSNAPDLH
jgi:adenine deaminase